MSASLFILLQKDHSVCLIHPTLSSSEVSFSEAQQIANDYFLAWCKNILQEEPGQIIVSGEPALLFEDSNGTVSVIDEVFGSTGIPVYKLHMAQALAHYYPSFEPESASQNMIVLYAGSSLLFSIVSGGRVIRGQHQLAGNLGESLIKNPGLEGNSFRVEPLKHFVSTQGIQRIAGSLIPRFHGASSLTNHHLLSLSIADFQQAAEHGDELANNIIQETGKILGMKLADLMSTSSPDQIIIHGPLAQLGNKFSEAVLNSMERNVLQIFRDKVSIHLRPETLSEKVMGGSLAFAKKQTSIAS